MKDNVYLIMDKNGARQMRKTKPKLSSGEVAVQLEIEISDEFFERFIPVANLEIPDDAVIKPEISVSVNRPDKPKDL